MESVMITGKDMEESKRRNESVQQGLQDPPHATEPPDVRAPAGLGVNLTANTLGNQIKGELIMSNRQEAQDYRIANDCEVDSETKESLVRHLEEHGIVSLLTSHKFAPYLSCVVKGIGEAMAETDTPIAPAADDATGNQDAAAPPAD